MYIDKSIKAFALTGLHEIFMNMNISAGSDLIPSQPRLLLRARKFSSSIPTRKVCRV